MIKPIGKFVLIKEKAAEKKTAGGLIIPETAVDRPQTGNIIAIGDEINKVAPGEEIVYAKYSGTEIKFDGQAYIIISERDILAKVEI